MKNEKWFDPSIELMEQLQKLNSCRVEGIAIMENRDVAIKKDGLKFVFTFQVPYSEYVQANQAKLNVLDEFKVLCNNQSYIVPKGSLITSLNECNEYFECSVSSQHIHCKAIELNKKCYFRCIIPIGKDTINFHDISLPTNFIVSHLDKKKLTTDSINIRVNDDTYLFTSIKKDGHSHIIIEPENACVFESIDKVLFSILVSHGFLCGTIYLNEVYTIFSDDSTFNTHTGIYYKSLRKTIRGYYHIFTTNAYSILVAIARNEDPLNGEKAAIERIEKEGWVNRLHCFGQDTFSALVEYVHNNDPILRAAMMIVESSKFAVDIQLAIFHFAFETIVSCVKAKSSSPQTVIDKEKWKKIKKILDSTLSKIDPNIIKLTSEEEIFIKKKLNYFNQPTNKDSIAEVFSQLNYTLNENETKCTGHRNLLFHGKIPHSATNDELDMFFYENLMMHKLCSILILKVSGFSGYIINNIKLHEKNLKIKITEEGFLKI